MGAIILFLCKLESYLKEIRRANLGWARTIVKNNIK